jgi:hypothetical protein
MSDPLSVDEYPATEPIKHRCVGRIACEGLPRVALRGTSQLSGTVLNSSAAPV